MRFLVLHKHIWTTQGSDWQRVVLNASRILRFELSDHKDPTSKTFIDFGGDNYLYVKESVEDIARMLNAEAADGTIFWRTE